MVQKKSKLRRYIVMPKTGFDSPVLKTVALAPTAQPVAVTARAAATVTPKMRVLDSISEDGPKLVEMSAEGELSLRLSKPELKIVPEVFYYPQWYRPQVQQRPTRKAKAEKAGTRVSARVARAAAIGGSTITVISRSTGAPLRGAEVIVFIDFATGVGQKGKSGANGVVRLKDISPKQKLERAYVYGPPGYWGYYTTGTSVEALKIVKLRPVTLNDTKLLLSQLYGELPARSGHGVTVGIVDTGVDGKHPDLRNVSGGLNCVSDEVRDNAAAAGDWGPAKREGEHGTHVAGIVAASGTNTGFRGVAPGATLRSYRVFPNSGGGASNFDIAKAIDTAIADHCDIINLSLGGGPADDLTRAAINRALAAGVVVIAAAGNDDRQPVSFPAAIPECVAVSAMGRRRSFPAESIGTSSVAKPTGGPGGLDFVADFSNFGSEIDVTGPGVEILSTLPRGQYGPMSGTSMATPAVCGFAAYLLSTNTAVRHAQGSDRSRKLKDLLYSACKPEGFGREYEGFGLPLPEAAATS